MRKSSCFLSALACLAAGTQIVTGINADGSYATNSIEQIQAGDSVLTRNQNNPDAPDVLEQVVAMHQHQVGSVRVIPTAMPRATSKPPARPTTTPSGAPASAAGRPPRDSIRATS
jgi:hypothetical protein